MPRTATTNRDSTTHIRTPDGKKHRYLNCGLPRGRVDAGGELVPLWTCVCPVCGHGYAHLYGTGRPRCDDCETERQQHRAAAVQRWLGVTLGASHKSFDPAEDRARYMPNWSGGGHKKVQRDETSDSYPARPDRRRGRSGRGIY